MVKGKRGAKCNRVILGESSNAVGIQSSSCTNFSQPKASVDPVVSDGQRHRPKAKPRVTDVVQFTASTVSTLGNKCRGSDCGDFGDCLGRDSSKPNPNHGVVQLQIQKSMERYIPINREECEGRVVPILKPSLGRGVEPVVVFFGRCTFANGGMKTNVGVFASSGMEDVPSPMEE